MAIFRSCGPKCVRVLGELHMTQGTAPHHMEPQTMHFGSNLDVADCFACQNRKFNWYKWQNNSNARPLVARAGHLDAPCHLWLACCPHV